MHRYTTWTLLGVAGAVLVGLFARPSVAEFVDDATPVPPVGTEGGPTVALTSSELQMWVRGRRVFDRDFRQSDGLGLPEFNGDSCRGCHQDPVIGGAGGIDLNVSRFGRDNGGLGPFQDLPGGQLNQRHYRTEVNTREEHPATADVFEQRQTPSILGLGLLEQVTEAEIVSNADPNDLDGDGIYGFPRFVNVGGGVMEIGRFGWKAGVPTLADFTNDAISNELGITVANTTRGFGFTSDNDPIPDPEASQGDLEDLTFFMRNLAPPPRGGSQSPLVLNGEIIFQQIGCAKCHVPTLMSIVGPVNAYTNLLLHEVSPTGFRGMAEPDAPAGFYRTPPLWGISRTAPYMHDGSASTLERAILSHDGEARDTRINYQALSLADREALIAFLNDL